MSTPEAQFTIDGETFRVGQKVSLRVEFRDMSARRMVGELIAVKDGEAFIDTPIGAMAGDALTLEDEE